MKITGRDGLNGFIRAPESGLRGALLYGVNYGLIDAILGAIKSRIADDYINISYPDIKKDIGPLMDAACANSLFSQKSIILVRDIGNSESISAALQKFLTDYQGPHYLVFIAGELESKSTLRAFFEKIKGYATVACYEDSAEVLPQIIRKWLRNNGCDDSEISPLTEVFMGSDRLMVQSELDRLALFFVDKPNTMSVKALAALATKTTVERDSMNALCFAALDGRLQAEPNLFFEAVATNDCGLIARSIARYLQRLLVAQSYVADGKSYADSAMQLKPPVFFKLREDFIRHMRKIDSDFARSSIIMLVDYESKRSSYADSQATVLWYLLCQMSNH